MATLGAHAIHDGVQVRPRDLKGREVIAQVVLDDRGYAKVDALATPLTG